MQAKETSPGPSKTSRPPPFPKRKKRRKSKVGRKKYAGQACSKRDSDATDNAGDTTNSSEFSDSEDYTVRGGGAGLLSSRGSRSAALSSAAGSSGSGVQRKHSLPSKRAEAGTPAAKRKKMQSVPDFKSEPGWASPVLGTSSATADRPKKKKRIPFTLVEASKGNRCPTEGCEGLGHITGLYAMHFAVSGCPIARGKTAEECKARREELNRLLSKNMPNEGEESGVVAMGERSLRRAQRSTVDDLVGGKGSVASLSMGRKTHAQVR